MLLAVFVKSFSIEEILRDFSLLGEYYSPHRLFLSSSSRIIASELHYLSSVGSIAYAPRHVMTLERESQ
jgi:hypothetical protein